MTDYTPEQQASIDEFQAALEKHCRLMEILDGGVFLGDWFVVGTAHDITRPNVTIYWRVYSNGSQPPHITAGLIKYASVTSESEIWNSKEVEDEGGE